ncbi:MAG TPA: helix-hairpin-helix domain-containing protein [Actinomycetes bacterium]
MSPRPSRHRRPDAAARTPGEALLARLGDLPPALAQPALSAPPTALTPPGSTPSGGWVPGRPAPPTFAPDVSGAAPLRVRWVPSRRAAAGLGLVLLVAGLVAVLLLWRAQPAARAAPPVHRVAASASPLGSTTTSAPAPGGAMAATGATSAAPTADVVVQVVGAVHRPGLVRLPAGSRVADAVRAAGGLTAGAQEASVNLARVLVDGEQLLVQRRGRPPILPAPGPAVGAAGGVSGGSAPGGSPTAPVDLNTATLEQLDGLPGIGPVLAQRILDWRTANGRFDSVDELGEVSGIGEAHLSDLRPLVVV